MPANSIKGYCPYSSFVGNKAKTGVGRKQSMPNKFS